MVSLNMALLVDLTGQIAAEGFGHTHLSGTGGQLDFQMGATWSDGGRALTLLSSSKTLKDGTLASSIVPELPLGTTVTVPRTYADYVITEFGVAHLRNKSLRERAEALIEISHPDLRGELRKSARKNLYPNI
jgi:4-hydroxybutyrate CoA-transferase